MAGCEGSCEAPLHRSLPLGPEFRRGLEASRLCGPGRWFLTGPPQPWWLTTALSFSSHSFLISRNGGKQTHLPHRCES